MHEIEAKLFALADQVRETNPDMARTIVAAIADMRAWLKRDQDTRWKKQHELFQKWSEFMNSSMQEVWDRQKDQIEHERNRVLRALAVDPRWQGSYADLVKLVGGE